MKKQILFPLLALPLLASCSLSDGDIDRDTRVPIRLKSGIGVNARATITDGAIGTGDDVSAQIEFWEVGSGESLVYTDDSDHKSAATVKSATQAADLELNPKVYYNANADITTHIKGWYPKIAAVSGVVNITNTAGTVDVVLSNTVSGKKGAEVNTAMTFAHQTAQLIFKVQKDPDGSLDVGTQIKSITVKGASVPTKITLGTPDVVAYTSAGDLAVPNLIQAAIGDAAVVGKPLMIEPVADNSAQSTPLSLDIVTVVSGVETTFPDIKFSSKNDKLEMGTAYTITLTFKQGEVKPTATITPWADATGAGDVI